MFAINTSRPRSVSGATLIEFLFGIGIIALVIGMITPLLTLRWQIVPPALANYADLSSSSLNSLDQLTRDIRSGDQADLVCHQ